MPSWHTRAPGPDMARGNAQDRHTRRAISGSVPYNSWTTKS